MTLDLVESHGKESKDDNDPVDVIADDTSISSGIGPAKDSVEDTPSRATIELWVAKVDVPDGLVNVV